MPLITIRFVINYLNNGDFNIIFKLLICKIMLITKMMIFLNYLFKCFSYKEKFQNRIKKN